MEPVLMGRLSPLFNYDDLLKQVDRIQKTLSRKGRYTVARYSTDDVM
jgi:hypothetical protein